MSVESRTPFDQETLNRIFTLSPNHPDRLTSRESSWLEFKESFSFGSLGKYIRSAAGFANAKGGYIVYGIGSNPHILMGLKNDSFDKLDPAKLAQFLNEHFDPEIHCDRQLYELEGKTFGLLYIYESTNKPVICKKGTDDGKSLKEGEIYYRYSGRTQTIRYPELKELMEERRKQEQLLWFKHLKQIARIGIQDVGLLDMRSGQVTGAGTNLLIDERLLSQIAFIRDGEFNEQKGKPAIKIVGTAQPVSMNATEPGAKYQILKTKGVRAPDIILAFLNSEEVADPRSYITQICYESSAFLPIYFLMVKAGIGLTEVVGIIEKEPSTSAAKEKLKERIKEESALPVPMPSPSIASGREKLKIRQALKAKKISPRIEGKELEYLLDVVRTLARREIDEPYIKDLLRKIFDREFGKGNPVLNDKIRRAVCYLDWRIFSSKVAKRGKSSRKQTT